MKTYKLFAYGTLRRGFHNHVLMHGAKFLGQGQTIENMAMVVVHGIPFTAKDEKGVPLIGELYEISEDQIRPIHAMEVHCGYSATWHSVVVHGLAHRALIYTFPVERVEGQKISTCDYKDYARGS
jgi:gamma-glutamylcyclotransferase (GGCT)/AIG2-like uncharacterized protein YtfP